MDIAVINQYETALQLMNTEIQKLLVRNDQLQKENANTKQQTQIESSLQQAIQSHGGDASNSGNPVLWLNSQIKDAKSQLQDLRHQN